jgi:hypothetical protein
VAGTPLGAPPDLAPPARPAWPRLLLTVGLAVQLAPVLLLPMVLTQDGPAHLDGAWVLLHHGDDDAVGAALREAYVVDLRPVPNMLTTLLLAGLLRVLGADAAEKVLVATFMVALVAAAGYALRGVDRGAGWLAVAVLPLASGQLLAYGFYNFCWGVVLALFALGVALRRRAGWTVPSALGTALLLLLTWFAHLLPWLVAAGAVGALAVGRWTAAVRRGDRTARTAARHLVPPLAAALPGVALTVAYLSRGGVAGAATGWPDVDRIWSLLTLTRPLVVASQWEIVPAIAVAAVLAGLAVVALRSRRTGPPDDGSAACTGTPAVRADRVVLGGATVLAAAVHLLAPSQLGVDFGFLPDRLAWFPLLFLVLFCATRLPAGPARQRAAAVVLVLAATAGALVRLPTQLTDQRQAADVLSVASAIPEGATFAVLRFAGHEAAIAPRAGEPDPLRHLSSRLAVDVGGIDIGHYEAVYPYFQVRFRAGNVRDVVDPGLDGLDEVPPWVHLSAAGERLPYVVVVGLDRAEEWVRSARRTAGVLADLRAHYVEVAHAGPPGSVTVWRLRAADSG